MVDGPVSPWCSWRALRFAARSLGLPSLVLPLAVGSFVLAVGCGGDSATVVGGGPQAGAPQVVAELPPGEPATETNGTGLATGEAAPDAGGSCSEASCSSSCPAPLVDGVVSTEPVWSRDPSSGACCSYSGTRAAPDTWPAFETEAACQNDCRCRDVERVDDFASERTSLECLCTTRDCPASIDAAIEAACSSEYARTLELPFVRTEGCGQTAIRDANGLFGVVWVFDTASGALVGAVEFADTPHLPCNVYDTVAGDVVECDERVDCLLCGTSPLLVPPPSCN